MNINFQYDASTSAAPAEFFTALNTVANFFDTTFLNNVTINIAVGWGEVGGNSLSSGALGGTRVNPTGGNRNGPALSYGLHGFSYSDVRAEIIANAIGAADRTVVANLASNDPTAGVYFQSGSAQEAALKLITTTQTDGWIGFSSTANTFNFSNSNRAQPSLYDFVGFAENEISQIMGRSYLFQTFSGVYNSASDLFRFSSPGVRDFANDGNAYFSIDGGVTNLGNFNSVSNGQIDNLNGETIYAGWAASAGNDAFSAFTNIGVQNVFSQADIILMEALGWDTVTGISRNSNDIFWYNQATNQVGEWQMGGNSPTWTALSSNANGWTVVGNGDYFGDGAKDILWFNAQSQQLGDWKDGNSSAWSLLSSNTSGWTVVGNGDYNGDGTSDILWYNAQSQQLGDWIMSGNNSTWNLLANNTSGWTVVGSGDYNSDLTNDILLYNASSHQLGDWTMSNNNPTWNLLTSNTNGWTVVGSGDYNGDGTSDILFYNAQTQQLGDWLMNNNTPTWNLLTNNTNGWTVVGSGDYNGLITSNNLGGYNFNNGYNGDGTSDILFYNAQTQQLGDWIMHNNVPTWNLLSNNTGGWTVTGGAT